MECGCAEAVLNLQPDASISIAYHSSFGSHEDLLLLEVDEKILPHFLHQRVSIRGGIEEDAVLCTPSTTYSMKFVGTSNSVFLIPPDSPSLQFGLDIHGNQSASVIKIAPGNIELVQIAPRLDKLKSLLFQNPYRLDEMDIVDGNFSGLYQWKDLVNQIQASDEELLEGLRMLSAVKIDECWRIVDEISLSEILSILLHNSVLYDWSLKALRQNEVLQKLETDGFPRHIVLHCMQIFGCQIEKDEGGIWTLDESKICVLFAKRILNGGKKKLENFMKEWKQSIPIEMNVSLDMLEGEILLEKIGIEIWIHPFSVSLLPSVPAERFSALFRQRARWEWKDLQPYIRDLRVPGISTEGLLIKYTRRTQPTTDVEPIFSAR